MSLANVQTANLERRMTDIRAGSTGFSSSGVRYQRERAELFGKVLPKEVDAGG